MYTVLSLEWQANNGFFAAFLTQNKEDISTRMFQEYIFYLGLDLYPPFFALVLVCFPYLATKFAAICNVIRNCTVLIEHPGAYWWY